MKTEKLTTISVPKDSTYFVILGYTDKGVILPIAQQTLFKTNRITKIEVKVRLGIPCPHCLGDKPINEVLCDKCKRKLKNAKHKLQSAA
jgi:hypothetical protein